MTEGMLGHLKWWNVAFTVQCPKSLSVTFLEGAGFEWTTWGIYWLNPLLDTRHHSVSE